MTTGRRTVFWLACLAVVACTDNMTDQPSYRPQDAPRLHSAAGSVPRTSRAHPNRTPATDDRGAARLFHINCAHCHGATGEGDGPVAPYLSHSTANLRAPLVQAKSDEALYRVLTEGLTVMPAFRGELSADERWALVRWIKSMDANGHRTTAGPPPPAAPSPGP